jgi:cytochrome c biogenesis factor
MIIVLTFLAILSVLWVLFNFIFRIKGELITNERKLNLKIESVIVMLFAVFLLLLAILIKINPFSYINLN